MIYVCTKCGYEVESDKQPDLCAMCYAAKHHMIPKKEQSDKQGEAQDKKQSGSLAEKTIRLRTAAPARARPGGCFAPCIRPFPCPWGSRGPAAC